MTEPRPFQPQLFLFRMLAAIFLAEAGFLAFAFVKCSTPIAGQPVPLLNERCPKLGERSETLFIAAITTTLSLLTGAGVAVNQRKSLNPASPLASSLPQQPQLPPEAQISSQEQSDPRQSNLEPPVSPDRPKKGSARKSARSQDRLED